MTFAVKSENFSIFQHFHTNKNQNLPQIHKILTIMKNWKCGRLNFSPSEPNLQANAILSAQVWKPYCWHAVVQAVVGSTKSPTFPWYINIPYKNWWAKTIVEEMWNDLLIPTHRTGSLHSSINLQLVNEAVEFFKHRETCCIDGFPYQTP